MLEFASAPWLCRSPSWLPRIGGLGWESSLAPDASSKLPATCTRGRGFPPGSSSAGGLLVNPVDFQIYITPPKTQCFYNDQLVASHFVAPPEPTAARC